jgi:HSP20 family protein
MALEKHEKHVPDWPSFTWPEPWRRWFDLEGKEAWLRTEEYHDGGTLVVRAELPDVDPEKDIDVTVSEGVVRISAHREQKAEHKDKRGYRSEFRYGEFAREIVLPDGASAKDVKATYTNGILEVRIPCPEQGEAAATKVPVTRS